MVLSLDSWTQEIDLLSTTAPWATQAEEVAQVAQLHLRKTSKETYRLSRERDPSRTRRVDQVEQLRSPGFK